MTESLRKPKKKSVLTRLLDWLSTCLAWLEEKVSLYPAAAIVAIILLLIAAFFVAPKFYPMFNGRGLAELAEDPFNIARNHYMQYRILGPLLGYLTGLTGDAFAVIPFIFHFAFIGSIYIYYRKQLYAPVDAFLMTSLIAFSGPIFVAYIAPGYTDTISFFLVFMAYALRKRPWLMSLFFFLALMNHEINIVFLLPLLLWASEGKSWKNTIIKISIPLIIALIPYGFWRYYVKSHATIMYDFSFYFNEANIKTNMDRFFHWIPIGWFLAFKLLWFFPLYLVYKWSRQNMREVLGAVVLFLLISGQLIIAYDITRIFTWAFLAVLVGAEFCKRYWSSARFRHITLGLILLNFLILQYYMPAEGLEPSLPWLYKLIPFYTRQ